MLDLYSLFWVIPGVIFIHVYNQRRKLTVIGISGWQYVFVLVCIAFITWVPSEFLYGLTLNNISFFQHERTQLVGTTILSIIFTFLWLYIIFRSSKFEQFLSTPVYDNFFNKCVKWENHHVILTLKNGKSYTGVLWKYFEKPNSKYETQTISIIPFMSGHRDNKTKTVEWDNHYPEYKESSDFADMEVIIPRSQIITFGKFNLKVFEHFKNQPKIKTSNAKEESS